MATGVKQRRWLASLKVSLLACCVLGAFIMSTFAWRRLQASRNTKILVAGAILSFTYALLIFELVNRTLAALVGAALAVAACDCLVDYAQLDEIIDWLDLETLSLLFGMMVMVNVLAASGLFDYLAVWCYWRAGGRFWLLITLVALATCLLSALVDNVSTMLLMAPTLIKLSELEQLDPKLVLMTMVAFCNLGGTATPVGDPPNLIIIGDELVKTLDLSFGSFTAYCAPGVLFACLAALGYLKLRYKSRLGFGNVEELVNSGELARSQRLDQDQISELMEAHAIKSWPLLTQSLSVLAVTVALFFLQSLPGSQLTLGWISLFAGLTLLVLSENTKMPSLEPELHSDNFERIMAKIEWTTLIFFFALFIIMEVMAKLGLIHFMGQQVTSLIESLPEGQLRSIGAISIVLWASGLASACVDNVPFTSMMVKVLGSLAVTPLNSSARDEQLRPLVFALAFGACFGGNGTLIGASANLVTAAVSSKHGYPITFNEFFKFCAPITVLTLIVANIYLVIVFVVLGL